MVVFLYRWPDFQNCQAHLTNIDRATQAVWAAIKKKNKQSMLLRWLADFLSIMLCSNALCKKATIHRVTIMLATSKKVLFPGHNHLLTTGTDDLTL